MPPLYWVWYAQHGECFYCLRQTWIEGAESKINAKKRLGVTTVHQLRERRATREHLHRRADGGNGDAANIVMACNDCNVSRGTKPVLLHLAEKRNGN